MTMENFKEKKPTKKQILLLRKIDPLAEEYPKSRKEAWLRIRWILRTQKGINFKKSPLQKNHDHRFRSKKWMGREDTILLWCKRCGKTILQNIDIVISRQTGKKYLSIKRIKKLPRMPQDQRKINLGGLV